MSTATARAWPALVLATLMVASCATTPEGDLPSPPVGPTTTPLAAETSPSASPPAPVPTAPPSQFRDRDPGMSHQRALERMADPQTDEFWLVRPAPLEVPPWAQGDSVWDGQDATWWELGRRGTSTIVGVGYPTVREFLEVDLDGHWTWLPFPSPREEVRVTTVSTGSDDLLVDPWAYYDTLALPDVIELPSGEPLLVPDADRGRAQISGDSADAVPTVLQTFGDYELRRYERSVGWVWDQVYPVTEPSAVNYRDVFYALATPYGMVIPLTYSPFGILEDVQWERDVDIARDHYLVDLNDIACGVFDTDHNTVVDGLAQSDWVRAGTNDRGDGVYLPASDNPLLEPMHAVAVAADHTPDVSVDEFASAPGIVGYFSRDVGAWVVYLNSAYSGRTWC